MMMMAMKAFEGVELFESLWNRPWSHCAMESCGIDLGTPQREEVIEGGGGKGRAEGEGEKDGDEDVSHVVSPEDLPGPHRQY